MKFAHFFDLDVLISVDSCVWIVSKTNPKSPIVKITPSEFNLIKSGVYRKFNCQLNISNTSYWLPENLFNELKIRCKTFKVNITDLAFSMQEFMNADLIQNLNSQILFHNFQHLKNSNDDIYVICSKNSEKNYEPIIKKLESKLFDIGLQIKKFYYLSETFYNRDTDYITHKKVRLLLQHLAGKKTDENKFTEEDLEKYNNIYFYDDEVKVIELAKNSQNLFDFLISNTDKDIVNFLKSEIKSEEHLIYVRQITHNLVKPISETKILIKFPNIVKTFENFKYKF